jgi:uncharacterized protein
MTERYVAINQRPGSGDGDGYYWILFAMSYPTFLTLTYFLWLSNSSPGIQQTAYALGKLIQFGFPILYVTLTVGFPNIRAMHLGVQENQSSIRHVPGEFSLRLADSPKRNLLTGAIFGAGVVAAMFLIYTFVLPETLMTQLGQKVQAKVESTGLDSPIRFLALSLFYVAGHSFLEEYYWRWFVFDQLQQKMSMWIANLIAGLGFMAHHVVLLGTFFGWDSMFTYVLSLSVAVGGMVWAWLFNRRWGFHAAWLSHAIVDAGIFALGMLILFAKN